MEDDNLIDWWINLSLKERQRITILNNDNYKDSNEGLLGLFDPNRIDKPYIVIGGGGFGKSNFKSSLEAYPTKWLNPKPYEPVYDEMNSKGLFYQLAESELKYYKGINFELTREDINDHVKSAFLSKKEFDLQLQLEKDKEDIAKPYLFGFNTKLSLENELFDFKLLNSEKMILNRKFYNYFKNKFLPESLTDKSIKSEHKRKHKYDLGYKNKGKTASNKKRREKSKRAKKARKKNR